MRKVSKLLVCLLGTAWLLTACGHPAVLPVILATIQLLPAPAEVTATAQQTPPPVLAEPLAPSSTTLKPLDATMRRRQTMYDGPGANYAKLRRLAKNEALTVIGRFRQCAWLQVRTAAGEIGWTAHDPAYIHLAAACEQLPVGRFALRSGTILLRNGVGGIGMLTIDNGTGLEGVVVLTQADKQPVVAMYIGANTTDTLNAIPPGEFQLFFATGRVWDVRQGRFRKPTGYSRLDKPFVFTQQGEGWQITLHKVVGGNLATSELPAGEFPNLSQ